MSLSRLSKLCLILFVIFLFFAFFSFTGWHFNFWLIRLSFLAFFISGLIIFFRPKNKTFTKIVSAFFPITLIAIPIGFTFGGMFMALVLGLLLLPVIGPTFQVREGNYVIQRPYQGFLGSAYRFELVERANVFEKKLYTFNADTARIGSFSLDTNTQKLSLNNGKKVINLKDFVK